MNRRHLRDFALPRFLLIAVVIGSIVFTGMNSVNAVVFIVPCDITQLNSTIANALPGDTINLTASCIYSLTSTLTFATKGTDSLTINGNGAILDGANTFQVLNVASGVSVNMNNITIRNGMSNTGGGIFNAGTLILTTSTLSANSANTQGGGILNQGTVQLFSSTVSGNKATGANSHGGAIYNDGGTVILNSVTLSRNSASTTGGGITNAFGVLNVIASTLSGNSVIGTGNFSGGGAIFNNTSNLTMVNSTVSGNSVGGPGAEGGAIDNKGGSVNVIASTVSGNSARGGGGINTTSNAVAVTLQNMIIAGNTAPILGPDIAGGITSHGFNLIGNGTGSTGATNGTNGDQVGTAANPINPLLGALASNGGPTLTMALGAGSPAIDAIPTASCTVSADQRGVARPVGLGCDIGAFESSFTAPNIPTLTGTSVPTASSTIPPVTATTTATSLPPTNTLPPPTVTSTATSLPLTSTHLPPTNTPLPTKLLPPTKPLPPTITPTRRIIRTILPPIKGGTSTPVPTFQPPNNMPAPTSTP